MFKQLKVAAIRTFARKRLGRDADRLQVVFITLDPERDRPGMLKAYLGSFDPTFVALVPPPGQVDAVAREFKIYFSKVPGRTPDSYSMDHTELP